jgi:peptidoglycan/xylan/chitin deacetylase (PgdA/CDA1 family)
MRKWLQKVRFPSGHKAAVLMYHRIADVVNDPWNLAVSPERFKEHIRVLKKQYNVISVRELSEQVERKFIEPFSVCITFDDGYQDNFTNAKPLLEKYQCPACFFIPTYFVGRQTNFWWDELAEILLLSAELPETFTLSIAEKDFSYSLGQDRLLSPSLLEKQKCWRWPDEPPSRRCELYLQVWMALKGLYIDQIEHYLQHIKSWAGYKDVSKRESLPMNNEELKTLAHNPLFEIGIHTHTHPALSFKTKEVQRDEIEKSETFFQHHHIPFVKAIAYPYGDFNNDSTAVTAEKKMVAAFTTQSHIVTSNSHKFTLGRLQIGDWDKERFSYELKHYFTGK